jgi:hypothetical protein
MNCPEVSRVIDAYGDDELEPGAAAGIHAPDARALRGFQVRHWTLDGLAFRAVSDLNDTELDQFVQALHP